jgi:flagellin
MSRINTNVQSLISQRILGQQNLSLSRSLERLSTGLAINRGADNPAGLIASENLRNEKASITQAIDNAERADQVVNIAEGGLQEISAMLIEIQGLVNQAANDAGLSPAEKDANQLQIDSILQTIDRIAASTSFQGTKLLNGTFDFTISAQDTAVADYSINAAKLEFGATRDIEVMVTGSAQHGALFLSAGNAGNRLDFGGNQDKRFVFEVAGSKGSREFSFASGTALDQVAEMINTFKSVTGVSAVASGVYLELKSDGFGSDHFVRVDIIDDAGGNLAGAIRDADAGDENVLDAAAGTIFANAINPIRDEGQDVSVIINGIAATAQGKVGRINTDFLDVSIELTDSGSQTLAALTAFTITGGGARFQLGPKVDIINQARPGIGDVASRKLGSVTDGYLDELISGGSKNLVDGDLEGAQKVVDTAISQIASLRGRLGAFQKNVIGATIRSLGVALENTSAAESSIRDTDFAAESAHLTRSQILVNAATSVLAIANAQPQSVLSLLGR